MYVLGDVVSIRAFENLIENYLAIKNSSRNELDVTDYSEIDIEEKIRMIEIKNNKKVIPNEFIVISFDHLSNDDKKRIINDIIDNVLKELDDEEKKIVPEEEIYSFYLKRKC